MLWQDWVLTLGSSIFIIALLPSVLSKNKPALSTSLMTGAVLIVFAIVYLTLFLWISAVTTFLTGGLWFVLAIQKYSSK
ncbi:MAG: hypothetical protein Q7R51_01420 [bacterium]|nr:hypothetical protein [bacterium]